MISSSGTMPEGLMVYDTDEQLFYYWDASIPDWISVANANSTSTVTAADWYKELTSTAPTAIGDHIYTNGNVGIGVNDPLLPLHVEGNMHSDRAIFGVAPFTTTTNNAELRLIDWFDDDNAMLEFGKANSDGSTWYMNVSRQGDGSATYPDDQGEMAFQIYN